LINKAIMIIIDAYWVDKGFNKNISIIIYLLKAPKRSKPDPIAWAKKYLMAASVSRLLENAVINGIKDKRFSSSPIQI
jgi:hypothetical protein